MLRALGLWSPFRRSLSVMPIGLFAVLLAPVPDGPSGVNLQIVPRAGVEVPQGAPFRFDVKTVNEGSEEVDIEVRVTLWSPSPRDPVVEFHRWEVTLPPGGTAKATLSVTPAQWFASLGRFHIAATMIGEEAGPTLEFDVLDSAVVVPMFQDVTAASGLDTTLGEAGCAQFSAGAAWGDIEGDGDLDLYVPLQDEAAQLWVNDGAGHFDNQAGLRGADNDVATGMAAVFADYDNDGDQDLYVINDGPNRLYRNSGSGTFLDVAPQAGVADDAAGSSASWGDYDADGHLDLYVTNYKDCSIREGDADRLYHNEGDGTFTDRTPLLGPPEATAGAGFQAAWFDYDDDGDQDLYLANDYLTLVSEPNRLWRNDGPGPRGGWQFVDVSTESGAGWAMNAMGIGVGDYDGDLDLDFAVSNIAGNVLARNNGDGTFTNVAAAAGVERPTQVAGVNAITWGLAFWDFNLDTREDLFVAAGSLGGAPSQPDEVFVNAGGGRFLDLSAPSGTADPQTGRGVAFADYDRDGRVDLYVVNQFGRPVLYRNVTSTSGAHWLEVRAVGTASNRDGCGARLILTVGRVRMLREVFCGSTSLGSGSDPTVHFGLGSAGGIGGLEILWPSGVRQVLPRVAIDRLVTVVEPS
ncbi:MAG: CRTAC1 family protein [Actinobacteria bacterium]|nr:CRTAC1 family protein [Actinomycetota bacterium]